MSRSDSPAAADPGSMHDPDPLAHVDPNKTLDMEATGSVLEDPGQILNIDAVIVPGTETHTTTIRNQPSSRFELRTEVGRGGMGEVHSCADIHLGRDVVAKILHEKYCRRPEVIARFREEIRITGQLEHPGVVPVYEAGVMPDGRPFFVMQRVWGLTLRKTLDERPNPGEGRSRMLKVFEQICHTIAYAHTQRIIHRDLNPSNIMVGLFGQVKVMDWGLAKSLDEGNRTRVITLLGELDTADPDGSDPGDSGVHTQVGSIMGTPAYMPPEQAKGEIDHLDERCDVFGLGAILCEILTGQPPYVAPTAKRTLQLAIQSNPEDAFSRLDNCHADHDLVSLAKACLAPDPAHRPRDAGVVMDRLTHYFDMVLRQAEWDLGRFFDLSLDLFCIAGFDGRFRRVNENFSRVLGYSMAELTADPFIVFVHPDDRDRTAAMMARLREALPVRDFRNRYLDHNGKYRWFEWTAKSIPKDDVIFAVAREVTKEVALEERLKELEAWAAAHG
ncbi:protein kinase domain-containing protein [Limnoglobus roseus]|uniref:Serine/threonine protein kinase n=1 Tax=Limnoglobus roseus TaxID=2598579 RepID=A0A5C1A5B2_9BACT|nr:protein kinase [Limnoglobus roseus]QEL14311.1 serine/threonine protein kinase [Limnoglobus roseus]